MIFFLLYFLIVDIVLLKDSSHERLHNLGVVIKQKQY